MYWMKLRGAGTVVAIVKLNWTSLESTLFFTLFYGFGKGLEIDPGTESGPVPRGRNLSTRHRLESGPKWIARGVRSCAWRSGMGLAARQTRWTEIRAVVEAWRKNTEQDEMGLAAGGLALA